MAFNVPNTITASRILMAIIIVWLLYIGGETKILAAGILLIVAALTDWLDGFLARRLGQSSLGGSLFDLVADEILFMPTLIIAIATGLFSRTATLMPLNPYPYAVPALPASASARSSTIIHASSGTSDSQLIPFLLMSSFSLVVV